MKANVYIDGFNLYYGSLKRTPYKWLNLSLMCRGLLPDREVNKIRYFTARITSLPHNPEGPDRQDAYLRALETLPNLTVHLGRFSSRPVYLPAYPLAYSDPTSPAQTVRVLRTEEKRSDVNLATLLLTDCVDDNFDEAVVISNDSDLTLPIAYAANRFGKVVGVVNPHRQHRISLELLNTASWTFKQINRSLLVASQFPDVVQHPRGPITKPASW